MYKTQKELLLKSYVVCSDPQALQQSMMQAQMHPPPPSLQEMRGDGLHPPAHPLQDPIIQAARGDGGMVPQVGGAGYATPGGLFVPSLAQQQQWRQVAQQQGGKARSQAIPIVSPEVCVRVCVYSSTQRFTPSAPNNLVYVYWKILRNL